MANLSEELAVNILNFTKSFTNNLVCLNSPSLDWRVKQRRQFCDFIFERFGGRMILHKTG